ILHLAVDPRGRVLASTSLDRTVRVWDLQSGRLRHVLDHSRLRDRIGYVVYACFSPGGDRLVTCTSGDVTGSLATEVTAVPHQEGDHYVHVWDVHSGQLISPLKGQTGGVNYVEYSPDGSKVLSVSSDQRMVVHSASSGQPLLPPFTPAAAACFSPDGES